MADIDYAKEARNAERIAVHTGGDLARYARMAAAVYERAAYYAEHLQDTCDQQTAQTLEAIIAAGRDEQARAEGGQVAEVGGEKSASRVVAGATGCEPAGFGGDVRTANEAASPQGVSTAPSAAPSPDEWSCPECDELGALCHRHSPPPAAVPDGDRVSLPRFGPEDAREFGRYVLTRWPVPTEREVADWWNARLASKEQP